MKCLVIICTLAAVAAASASPFYYSPYGSYHYPTSWRNINPYGGHGVYGVINWLTGSPVGTPRYPYNLYPTLPRFMPATTEAPEVAPTTVEDEYDYYDAITDTPDVEGSGSTTNTTEEHDGACENAFNNHTSNYYEVKCIVYDDENCNSEDWVLTLGDGSSQTLTGQYKNNIESVSIKKGCKLSLFMGENQTGSSVVFPASQGDWHGTLDTYPVKYIQTFDDQANSITCDCN